jgi:hypothetical protein
VTESGFAWCSSPRPGGSVGVSVVSVREVRMQVERARVGVRVRVRLAPEVRLGMVVLVMLIVGVAVLMDDGCVQMPVLMPLGQV